MKLSWVHENPPHWDEAKQGIVAGAPAGIFREQAYTAGQLLPGEWWRVDADGEVVGYGWMDTTWGDAEILLAVDPSRQGRGVGGFILDRLEHEAQARGLNYLHNVVLPTHPDQEGITRWLEKHGFKQSTDGLLKRSVPPVQSA